MVFVYVYKMMVWYPYGICLCLQNIKCLRLQKPGDLDDKAIFGHLVGFPALFYVPRRKKKNKIFLQIKLV